MRRYALLQRAWACRAGLLDSYAGGVLAALGGMSMISNSLQTHFCAAPPPKTAFLHLQ